MRPDAAPAENGPEKIKVSTWINIYSKFIYTGACLDFFLGRFGQGPRRAKFLVRTPINIIDILKSQNGTNRDKLPPTLAYSSLYPIALKLKENSIKKVIEKKLEKEEFKCDYNRLFDNYIKQKIL